MTGERTITMSLTYWATAIMCAEAVPWRCHRYLIADALVVRGFSVEHMMGPGVSREHSLHPLAEVDKGTVRYPATPVDATARSRRS
jgi:uncharacterized protein (DUF488 family)